MPRAVAVVHARDGGGAELMGMLADLGYEGCETNGSPDETLHLCVTLHPAVAFVARSGPAEDALTLMGRISREGGCPAIAFLAERDSTYVREAARQGAFGYFVGSDPDDLQGTIDIAVARFAQYRDLQEAFGRRAIVEQAKGILMAQHGIESPAAFDLLRGQARRSSSRVVEIASAVIQSYGLIGGGPSGDGDSPDV
jgi:response regulator NasT